MSRKAWPILLALLLLAALPACGGSTSLTPTAGEEPTTDIEVASATLAHGLNEQMQPVNPGDAFTPREAVHLSLQLANRPRSGIIRSRFLWHETLIAEAEVDLADANSGVIFSIGEDTYVGFSLSDEQPFPISEAYRAEVYSGPQLLGVYPFRVVPPPEAIPSNVLQVTLALGVDEGYTAVDQTAVFGVEETVHLVGRGDLGLLTWLQAEWYVAGELDEAGTRRFTLDENVPDVGFYFSYIPESGWPPGEHLVVLSMNDQIVGRYPFLVISSSGAAPLAEPDFWDVFPLPDDAELLPATEGIDLAFASELPQRRILDLYGAWLRQQGWTRQSPSQAPEETLSYEVWHKESWELVIEGQGLDEAGRTVIAVSLDVRS